MTPKLDTPMLRQYWELKLQHQDSILFFRLGDFYEMFLDDAKLAAKELDLVLTGRGKDENRVPMCGIPHHSSEQYILRLVAKGYKVAICEQVEDASVSKGLTKRDVVKIVTPGTVIQENGLKRDDSNYLMAIGHDQQTQLYGCAFMELSTGEFQLFTCLQQSDLHLVMDKFQPKEVMIKEGVECPVSEGALVSSPTFVSVESARQTLCSFFSVQSLNGFGIESMASAFPAAAALVEYIQYTQKGQTAHLVKLTPYRYQSYMTIDATTLNNLEILRSVNESVKGGALFDALNQTKTAMGARQLKQMLRMPLLKVQDIEDRLDVVSFFKDDILSREEIRDILNSVYDLERLIGRIGSGLQNPRDCFALLETLKACAELPAVLEHFEEGLLRDYFQRIIAIINQELKDVMDTIQRCLVMDPPAHIREGGIIRDGYDEELDALNESFRSVRDWIEKLEGELRQQTGIKTLKVRYNKVFGYYIEVSKLQQDKVPDTFIRKQTLTNAERYITPELKEKETIILKGEERQIALEQAIYQRLVETILESVAQIQELAHILAMLDVFQSMATVAQRNGYSRPEFVSDSTGVLVVQQGRHPVLEQTTTGSSFVPNDIQLDESERFLLITGPNMAGKSTMMRQVALWILMAQMGSFVPADSMKMSIVDQLFSRIGAMDNLYHGQSTFMVEMLETAKILHNATDKSFVILDEVGRGTATYDGVSLAYSISEFIHDRLRCRTLFATHYHELTQLAARYSAIQNYNMKVEEVDGNVVFTYQFKVGCADKSYGIHVAQMAGIPASVTNRATEIMVSLEQGEGSGQQRSIGDQLSLF